MSENFAGPYHAESVVAYFTQKNNNVLDRMKANKLAYFAYCWGLVTLPDKLFHDTVEAWKYGPVVPNILYRETYYKCADWPLHYRMLDKFDDKTIKLLDRVWEVYGKYTKYQLSNMSHAPDSVWKKFVGDSLEEDIVPTVIPDKLIYDHYFKLAMDNKAKKEDKEAVVDLVVAP